MYNSKPTSIKICNRGQAEVNKCNKCNKVCFEARAYKVLKN